MNSIKSMGPSTVSCGTPEMIGASDEVNPPTTTRCCLRVKKAYDVAVHVVVLERLDEVMVWHTVEGLGKIQDGHISL